MVVHSESATRLTALRPRTEQIFLTAAVSCLGWALDLYDLLILLYVAPVVGRLFFPASEPLLSLAAVSPRSP
jgi:hypothetical protein